MIRFFLLTLILTSTAQANQQKEITFSQQYIINLCAKPDGLRRSYECFKTPEGKFLYEYPNGAERIKWYEIARKERLAIIRNEIKRDQQIRKEGKRAAKKYQEDQTRCKFWRDQNDSPRRTKILEEEC